MLWQKSTNTKFYLIFCLFFSLFSLGKIFICFPQIVRKTVIARSGATEQFCERYYYYEIVTLLSVAHNDDKGVFGQSEGRMESVLSSFSSPLGSSLLSGKQGLR